MVTIKTEFNVPDEAVERARDDMGYASQLAAKIGARIVAALMSEDDGEVSGTMPINGEDA